MDFSALISAYKPPSPAEEDVLYTLNRSLKSKRPLRHVADCIIRNWSIENVVDLLYNSSDDGFPLDVDEAVTKGLRLLHFSVYKHNLDITGYLLERGANPNLMDEAGYTPIHLCAERGYNDLIPVLVQYGARLRFTELNPDDIAYGDPARATSADEPLRLAIKNGQHETSRLLLQLGANPNASYYLGQEINLVNSMDLVSLELLLNFGADPNSRDLQGMTPIMKACRNPEAIETVYLLISHGADVNSMTDSDERSPLHYAVLTGNLEIVQVLVENGSVLRFPPEYSKPPPLYFAVLKSFLHIVEYLINSGADVNVTSDIVGSALHVALVEKVTNKFFVVKALLEKGADPNAITWSENRPMMKPPLGEYFHSCEHPELEIIRLLLKYGARVFFCTQRDHPLGIVKVIHRLHLGLNPEVMDLVVQAAEGFNISFISESKQLSDEHKEILLEKAFQPFSLMHLARMHIRRYMGWGPRFVSTIEDLDIPSSLKKYIFFET